MDITNLAIVILIVLDIAVIWLALNVDKQLGSGTIDKRKFF